MSRRQRAVGHEGNAHLLTNGNQFPFVLPVEQVVVVLHGLKLRPAVVTGDVLFQCPPQIFLAGSGRVAIGGIKKVDFQRKCVFDHFLCFCFIQRPVVHGPCLAEAHAADTQLGDLNIRIS